MTDIGIQLTSKPMREKRTQAIPKCPNTQTLAALDELERGKGKRFATLNALIADLESNERKSWIH